MKKVIQVYNTQKKRSTKLAYVAEDGPDVRVCCSCLYVPAAFNMILTSNETAAYKLIQDEARTSPMDSNRILSNRGGISFVPYDPSFMSL